MNTAMALIPNLDTLPAAQLTLWPRARLARAVERVDVTALPVLTPYVKRPDNESTP